MDIFLRALDTFSEIIVAKQNYKQTSDEINHV